MSQKKAGEGATGDTGRYVSPFENRRSSIVNTEDIFDGYSVLDGDPDPLKYYQTDKGRAELEAMRKSSKQRREG
ncbi:hypothetical protein [Candidatus Magnetominusculus dajiuhuensis]|uniref:hypothetical protein n=1 Tax=Candidatus Magnetominusculus dajiuhuensis TaxID=3137712 RepID=UPI003B433499